MDAFTSITANYLPKARVLARSFKKFHPEAGFHLVLSDKLPDWYGKDEPFDSVITVEELPIPDIRRWLFKHSLVEICTGVKGAAFQEIFRRNGSDAVFYFDPDMVLFSRLDALMERFDKESILLTPHLCEPEDNNEAVMDNEICALQHGVYNLGFLGVKDSPEGKRFTDWWAKRLADFCYDNIPGGLFTDQRWADFVPAFFSGAGIVREPNYNVATWNLTKRTATGSLDDGIKINGLPLCFYHFSGFDSGAQGVMLKKYGGSSPVLSDLRDWYIEECRKTGQDEYGETPCVYQFFDNGESISKEQRLLYRNRGDLHAHFKNPFATSDVSKSYYHWFKANAQTGGKSSDNAETVESLRKKVAELEKELESARRGERA